MKNTDPKNQYLLDDGTIVPGDKAHELITFQESHDRVYRWLESAPEEIRRGFNTEPAVRNAIVEAARRGQTTENMLWFLATELLRGHTFYREELIRTIERSAIPVVKPV